MIKDKPPNKSVKWHRKMYNAGDRVMCICTGPKYLKRATIIKRLTSIWDDAYYYKLQFDDGSIITMPAVFLAGVDE